MNRGGGSRTDAAHQAEEARASATAAAAAADLDKLEREAPIRGLAKYGLFSLFVGGSAFCVFCALSPSFNGFTSCFPFSACDVVFVCG